VLKKLIKLAKDEPQPERVITVAEKRHSRRSAQVLGGLSIGMIAFGTFASWAFDSNLKPAEQSTATNPDGQVYEVHVGSLRQKFSCVFEANVEPVIYLEGTVFDSAAIVGRVNHPDLEDDLAARVAEVAVEMHTGKALNELVNSLIVMPTECHRVSN
jgi:hypothetical protein